MIRNLTTVSLLCESMRGRTRVWARACLNPGILIVHTFALEVVMVLMLIVCGFGSAWRVRSPFATTDINDYGLEVTWNATRGQKCNRDHCSSLIKQAVCNCLDDQ